MKLVPLVLASSIIAVLAHEAFHVATVRMAGGKNVEVVLSPFYENNGNRRTLFYTQWDGPDYWPNGEDEVVAWALTTVVFLFSLWALRGA